MKVVPNATARSGDATLFFELVTIGFSLPLLDVAGETLFEIDLVFFDFEAFDLFDA